MLIPGKETEEKRRHSTAYIPYSFYDCRLPTYFASVPLHWHNEFELDFVAAGAGEFTCGGVKYQGRAGDLMLLPPGMLHAAYPWGKAELNYYALVFSPALLGAGQSDRCAVEALRPLSTGALQLRCFIPAGAACYPALRQASDQIFACVGAGGAVYGPNQRPPQPDLLLKSELLKLFWLLLTDPEGTPQTSPEAQNLSGSSGVVRAALDYMQEHYREPVSVSQLARQVHLSESYFMASFKKAAGVSAIEYLAQLRTNAACEALTTTEQPVAEIASAAGFGNLSNFNRQFKKLVGCTPREYRRNAAGR